MLSAVKSGSRLSGGQVGKGGKMMPQKATADGAADFKLYAVFGMEAPKELISRYTTYLFLFPRARDTPSISWGTLAFFLG